MELDPKTQERIDEPVSEEAQRETRLTPAEAVAQMRIRVPERANRKLRTVIERANRDEQLKGWWHAANVNAVVPDVLQGIISPRADGEPLTLEAGIFRVADALDMEQGRSRIAF